MGVATCPGFSEFGKLSKMVEPFGGRSQELSCGLAVELQGLVAKAELNGRQVSPRGLGGGAGSDPSGGGLPREVGTHPGEWRGGLFASSGAVFGWGATKGSEPCRTWREWEDLAM